MVPPPSEDPQFPVENATVLSFSGLRDLGRGDDENGVKFVLYVFVCAQYVHVRSMCMCVVCEVGSKKPVHLVRFVLSRETCLKFMCQEQNKGFRDIKI